MPKEIYIVKLSNNILQIIIVNRYAVVFLRLVFIISMTVLWSLLHNAKFMLCQFATTFVTIKKGRQ